MHIVDSLVTGVTRMFTLCLLLLPFALLGLALWTHKKHPGFPGNVALFFAGHSFTFAFATLVYLHRAELGWGILFSLLPLFITLFYLSLGTAFRLPALWILGITTPGVWFLFQRAWAVVAGAPFYRLPQDPVWYLLGAAALFWLPRIPRFAGLWGEVEDAHLTASGCYAMGALWLPAIGRPGILGWLGLSPYIWALALLVLAAFLFWAARVMRDKALQAGCAAGAVAGIYALIAHFSASALR